MESKRCIKCEKDKPQEEFSKHKSYKSSYSNKCLECHRKRDREKYKLEGEETKKNRRAHCRNWHSKNKEKLKSKYYENHQETLEKNRKYYKKNREKILKYNSKWIKNKLNNDILFKLEHNLRSQLYRGIKFFDLNKDKKTIDYLGCTIEELFIYFQKVYKVKLTPDMIGRGKGKWSIDHIKPISSFDLTKEEDIKECFHFTNLQPMLFEENCSKRNKI